MRPDAAHVGAKVGKVKSGKEYLPPLERRA
jgi:hypothetical protein